MTSSGKAHPGFLFLAFIGALYFVCIGLGYMIFAGALPEMRLRYLLIGIVVTLAFGRAVLWAHYRVRPQRFTLFVYALFAGLVVVQLAWFLPIRQAGGEEIYITTIGDTMVSSLILLITGEAFGSLWNGGRRGSALAAVMLGLLVCIFTILTGLTLGWSNTAELQLMFQSQTGELTYNYLALGDAVAVLGLLGLGLMNRRSLQLLAVITIAAALFFSYSRTSFFLFIISTVCIFLIGGKYAERLGVIIAVIIGAVWITILAAESDMMRPAIERMTVLLTDREADESYKARRVILSESLRYLQERWVMGRFLDEWWRTGEAGDYIHNWLSFWQAYGIVPFFFSIGLLLTAGRGFWRELKNPRPTTGAALALWTYCVLAMILSRAYVWPFYWLVVGFSGGALGLRQHAINRSGPTIS